MKLLGIARNNFKNIQMEINGIILVSNILILGIKI